MIEIDPYFFYWVSRDAYVLLRGLSSKEIPSYEVLHLTRNAFAKFIGGEDKGKFLPKSRAKAIEIASTFLQPCIVALENGNPLHFNESDYATYFGLLTEFEEIFREESKHLYAMCVEDQRVYSAYVLIEHIEEAVAPDTWKYMSKTARAELKEAGRCLALERYTASGFHLLRCVESIVKEYIDARQIPLAPGDRNWGKYADALKKDGAAPEVTSYLDSLRVYDRNPLMHPEKTLNIDEAIELFCLCQTALGRLLRDMERRKCATEFKL
jgi:hypothetical protein